MRIVRGRPTFEACSFSSHSRKAGSSSLGFVSSITKERAEARASGELTAVSGEALALWVFDKAFHCKLACT